VNAADPRNGCWPIPSLRSVELMTAGARGLGRRPGACQEELETKIPPIDATVSTTEATVFACALLRAQHMNPFDLAVWFQRTTTKAIWAPRQGEIPLGLSAEPRRSRRAPIPAKSSPMRIAIFPGCIWMTA
jgi:hypothetical protein